MPDSRWKLVSIRTLCGEGDGRRGKAERHQFQHFYPRPPQGGRPTIRRWTMPSGQFLSTPSARRATSGRERLRNPRQISIHALREEGDPLPRLRLCVHQKFLSTPSARRATKRWRPTPTSTTHFYPRPPRGGRLDDVSVEDAAQIFLSTPSARRATGLGDKWFQDHQISIHALREEGDHSPASSAPMALYFYPRPPRGGRPGCTTADGNAEVISIHALREEGDASRCCGTRSSTRFLSTPSARRATGINKLLGGNMAISIHALREEGDVGQLALWRQLHNFYPRPPRGGRRAALEKQESTKPISIHALREEGDLSLKFEAAAFFIFPSTPSARRATARIWVLEHLGEISIHALREEGDAAALCDADAAAISIHALREEGDCSSSLRCRCSSNFYPRPPRGGRPQDVVFVGECNFISIHALREEGDP